jgi:nucleotide-binding universal stress UspA family protein
MLPIKTILHPTDFSERAGHAFELAFGLAKDYGAKLIVLHVVSRTDADSSIPIQEYQEQLDTKLRWLTVPNAPIKVDSLLLYGVPAAEILRAAEENYCDLIVMGTHGEDTHGSVPLGSVAGEVVRKAHCPVVAVRIPYGGAALSSNPVTEGVLQPA